MEATETLLPKPAATRRERRLESALRDILTEATRKRHSWRAVGEAREQIRRIAEQALR